MYGRPDANHVRAETYDGDDVTAFATSFRLMVSGRRYAPVAVIEPETTTRRTAILRRSVALPSPFQASMHLPGDDAVFGLDLLLTTTDPLPSATADALRANVGRPTGDPQASPPWPVDADTFAPDLFVNPHDITTTAPEDVGLRVFAALRTIGGSPPTGRWSATWQCSRNIWRR
ncbi:MAG: hypothetical protein AAF962_16455 [Actinomycetota bacterium]